MQWDTVVTAVRKRLSRPLKQDHLGPMARTVLDNAIQAKCPLHDWWAQLPRPPPPLLAGELSSNSEPIHSVKEVDCNS